MPRQPTLTPEQKKLNRKNLDSHLIKIYVPKRDLNKIDQFAKQYKSRNASIVDLIKTHPDFLKMFPPAEKTTVKQIVSQIK